MPRLKLTSADLGSYHFLRLLIRAPSAADPILGISSLAILARSATLLLQHYERIFLTTHYVNCAWTVFARIVGAGHVVLQAVWRGEMIRLEAADLMGKVLWFLGKLETRWTETAAVARKNFLTLMDALSACRSYLADRFRQWKLMHLRFCRSGTSPIRRPAAIATRSIDVSNLFHRSRRPSEGLCAVGLGCIGEPRTSARTSAAASPGRAVERLAARQRAL